MTSLDSIPEASPAPETVVVLAGMEERRGSAAANTGAWSAAVAASSSFGSGSGHTIQGSNMNEAMSSDGRRQSFSSESTIPSMPIIVRATVSGSSSSSSIKGGYQPRHQHQQNNSVASTATSASFGFVSFNIGSLRVHL